MKKRLLTLGILGLGFLCAFGQKLHTPAEVIDIMQQSFVSYQLILLEDEILPPDRTNNLNYNHYYRKVEEGQIVTYRYEASSDLQSYLAEAEGHYQKKNYASAREMYLEVLKADSTYYQVMTYIGQTYEAERDFDNAIEWYEKTISLNYIDYMAHWFLADAYRTRGELDKAVDEITIAMILNRNNPRIKKSFNDIYALKKLKTNDWTFNPQIKFDSLAENQIEVFFHTDWLGYAIVKALWKYEPGYKESMGVSEGSFSINEEKEGFLCLIPLFDKKKLKSHPEFNALQLSVDNNMIDEFIFYEIVLPEHPFVAYQLSEEFINKIKDYVIEVRGKVK